ncbi:septum formation family protein [Lentzea sp. BCCO 10_0856]|uniref:Septum formation family protein n=1 Tax=Lentzea miocenica TaxID=3095431 RepID=A0ABU4T2J7_9PSEU|nr:septum formation family protein [Lentzea sp. BCCO 10_0856]MDX8032232.1 septum formation family protein [Lentzea sp. BCCO 10_0856]
MVGAFVGAFGLLMLSAFTSVLAGGPLSVKREQVNAAYQAASGECLNWEKADLSDAQKVDCSAAHKFEVTGTADIAGAYPKEAPFPTPEAWEKISQENCAQAVTTYMSGKLDPEGKYGVSTLNPDEKRWSDGYRQIRCGLQVTAPSGAPLPSFGSAKTQDQSNVYDPGVCVALGEKNTVGDPIECAKPHAFEIVGVVQHPEGEFLPIEKQDAVMLEKCAAVAAEYTGGADLRAKGLLITWDTRSDKSWAVGSRKANCKVGAVPQGENLVAWEGTVRNPNGAPLTTSNPPQTTSVKPQAEPTGAPLHSESGQPPSESGKPSNSGKPDKPSSSAPTTTTENR